MNAVGFLQYRPLPLKPTCDLTNNRKPRESPRRYFCGGPRCLISPSSHYQSQTKTIKASDTFACIRTKCLGCHFFLQLNNNWVTQSKTAHPPGSQLFPWRGSCSQGWYSHPGVYRRLVSTTFSLLSPQGGYSWGGCGSFPETSLLPAQCWSGDHHIDGQEEEELEAAQLTCKWKR